MANKKPIINKEEEESESEEIIDEESSNEEVEEDEDENDDTQEDEQEGSENEQPEEKPTNPVQEAIKKQLNDMTFEEIQSLQNKLGLKK